MSGPYEGSDEVTHPSPKRQRTMMDEGGVIDCAAVGVMKSEADGIKDPTNPLEHSDAQKKDLVCLEATTGVTLGGKIEVKWIIEDDVEDNEECSPSVHEKERQITEESIWWPASIVEADGDVQRKDGHRVWKLAYERRDEFAAEECRVIFLDAKSVEHIDLNVVMKYRREGQGDSDSVDSDEDPELTLEEIFNEMLASSEGQEGKDLEAEFSKWFSKLPCFTQQTMVLGFRRFADELKSYVSKKCADEGSGYCVTATDIQVFAEKMKLIQKEIQLNEEPPL